MTSETIHNTTTLWRSEQRPDVTTDDIRLSEVIAWADDNPLIWKIVTRSKSKAFGRGSSVYIGYAQRSMAPEAILERARHLHALITGTEVYVGPGHIFRWRARFTFEHFRDRGFTGGFFQQHDEKYPRLCLSLDYTHETLEDVIDHFLRWCARDYVTSRITVDGRVVREFGGDAHG